MKPVIFGLSGPALTDGEAAFFRDVEPAGFILFGRNVVDRPQLRALTDSLRTLTGRDDLPIPEKVRLDREYMERMSFGFDLRVILATAAAAISARGVSH